MEKQCMILFPHLIPHDIHLVQQGIVVDELLQASRHCDLQPKSAFGLTPQ